MFVQLTSLLLAGVLAVNADPAYWIFPPPSGPGGQTNNDIQVRLGSVATLQFYSNYSSYRLSLWQQQAGNDGSNYAGLIYSVSSGGLGQVSYNWTVSLFNTDLTSSNIYYLGLGLEQANGITTHYFDIISAPAVQSTTSTTSSTIPATTATTMPSALTTAALSATSTASGSGVVVVSTTSAIAASASGAMSTATGANESGSSSNSVAIGAGVGVGVGVALILAAVILALCWRRRRSTAPQTPASYYNDAHPPTYSDARGIEEYKQAELAGQPPAELPDHRTAAELAAYRH